MEHDSLADFTDKVTSKELFNITIKESLVLHCLEMLLNPFCFNSIGSLPPFGQKAKRWWIPQAKFKKSAKIKMYCMQLSDTLLQLLLKVISFAMYRPEKLNKI
jgi:hypothetical protein